MVSRGLSVASIEVQAKRTHICHVGVTLQIVVIAGVQALGNVIMVKGRCVLDPDTK